MRHIGLCKEEGGVEHLILKVVHRVVPEVGLPLGQRLCIHRAQSRHFCLQLGSHRADQLCQLLQVGFKLR